MLSSNFHQKIKRYVAILQAFADRFWYPQLVGLLAALDNFIVVIPNDGILISSSMLTPKRWFTLAFWIAVGSTVGAVGLATLTNIHGLPWIIELFPGADQSATWSMTESFFHKYGLIVLFVVAVSPLVQQPAIILASLADTPIFLIASAIFSGRFIKFLLMAYIGSHAPRLIGRMWGIKGELEDVGVKVK
jgi:membrane protein YqaA with SNARE-associated domain